MKLKNLTLIPLILTALNAEVQELNYASDAGGNLLSVTPAYTSTDYTPTASITHSVEGAVVSLEVTTGGYANGVVPNYYEWDFDSDGEVDVTTMTPTIGYSYPTAGSHTITLAIYDSLDEAREYTQSVTTTGTGTGEVIDGSGTTYGLAGTAVHNQVVVDSIKGTIDTLSTIRGNISDLNGLSGATLQQQYDTFSQQLDGAMSSVDAIKQAIDNSTASNTDKETLKAQADKVKTAIEDVKNLIESYKQAGDNSPEAIQAIQDAIDGVIAMLRSDDSTSTTIYLKAGRNTVSGTIDVRKLDEAIHSIWIVDGGNWWGYSPHSDIRTAIESKYLLIEDTIRNYKGALVYAISDTSIESADPSDPVTVTHEYGRGYTLHGTDGVGVGVYDIECTEPNKLIMVAKVRGDVPSIYVPDQTINGIENIDYLYENDGYYVLCDKE